MSSTHERRTYVAQTRTRDGWSEPACGDVTRFATEQEAQRAIDALVALGEFGDATDYRIVTEELTRA